MRSLSAFAILALFACSTISATAEEVFKDRNGVALPPIAELAKKTGDAAKGATSFAPFCGICHQINGAGVDFGPNLSDVGSRKTKENILESILKPSAVIEPGFHSELIKLESDEVAMGLIVAETDSEVTVKAMGGAKTVLKKSEIVSRTKQATSMMMPGLHATFTTDDLVNVVEYLYSLKAAK
jgi:putative heme-binding domain-containing protein